MKRRTLLLTILISSLLGGCATPKYNYQPERTEMSEPPLNTVVRAYVGDAMVQQGKFIEHDAIYILKDTKVGTLGTYTFTKGFYDRKGEDQKSEYYLPSNGPESGRIIKSALADPFQIIRLDKKTGKLCGVTVLNLQVCTSKTEYERRKHNVASADSFQQTLLYSGKVGEKINVGYREFSNDVARPAFNNDVEYDLSESKMIGYKGCQVEVIEATNEYIEYKVIRNFNLAKY